LLNEVLSGVNPASTTPAQRGYQFHYLAPNPAPSADQPNETFSLVAVPVTPGQGSTSTFCIDQTNVVGRDISGKATSATETGCDYNLFPPL
jgi:hypothetical protein